MTLTFAEYSLPGSHVACFMVFWEVDIFEGDGSNKCWVEGRRGREGAKEGG